MLVTRNETNRERIFGQPNLTPWVKDGIDRAIVQGDDSAIHPDGVGTKAAAHYRRELAPGESWAVELPEGTAMAIAADGQLLVQTEGAVHARLTGLRAARGCAGGPARS